MFLLRYWLRFIVYCTFVKVDYRQNVRGLFRWALMAVIFPEIQSVEMSFFVLGDSGYSRYNIKLD